MARIDKTPIYQLSAAYARENGELEQYHASRKLNRACKDAIEAAIQEHFDGTYLSKTAVDGVLKQFSPERVTYVLANTVQQQDWDGRFFSSNKSWARTVPMYVPERERLAAMLPFQSLSFSELEGRKGTYALISQNENRFQPLRLRKPSVRKKLQERADAPKTPGRGRAREQER